MFAHNNLTELYFTNGSGEQKMKLFKFMKNIFSIRFYKNIKHLFRSIEIYPERPFRPDYANDSYEREFFSVFGGNGAPGVPMKSDFGLNAFDYESYKNYHCLYRISLTNVITNSEQYLGDCSCHM